MSGTSRGSSESNLLGELSSDVSASETLVASQIDLGRDYALDEDESSQKTPRSGDIASRSVLCEARTEGEENRQSSSTSGLPVTLTSSTSGTTVCTQVETTYEARVRGDPEIENDQDGNTLMYMESEMGGSVPSGGVIRTHRRVESGSWNDALLYGIEEKLEEDTVYHPVEEEISDLFQRQGSTEVDDPVERPITPEPGTGAKRIVYYPGTSLESEEDIVEEFVTSSALGPQDYYPQRLEDIEEEGSSVKNSPKSVLSLELLTSSNGNVVLEKPPRPGSRESLSSLNEFEKLESDVLKEEEELSKKDLSEIEEGHESQVSESDETEIFGEQEEPDVATLDDLLDDDNLNSFSSSSGKHKSSTSRNKTDPMMFFSTTVQSPEDSQCSEEATGFSRSTLHTTDADSSLEFFSRKTTMTTSGDSLEREDELNLMQVSRDSLEELKKSGNGSGSGASMTDSLQRSGIMMDSIEMAKGENNEGGSKGTMKMTESTDSLQEGAVGGIMATSSDSLEGAYGGPGLHSSSSNTSTAADAAVWSSGGGSESTTIMSSQEDLTLENQ